MTNKEPDSKTLLDLYRSMLLIRRVEERLRDDFHAGKLPGGVHLYIGQEAIASGVCAHLNTDDWIASTHRGHGHFLDLSLIHISEHTRRSANSYAVNC